ncbi:MAG TPA: hypothetical protein VFS44_10075 [Gemmatimonadaceae bacterium]|nr:hypothetical protein [Gemmatimonadaceae bacterium]
MNVARMGCVMALAAAIAACGHGSESSTADTATASQVARDTAPGAGMPAPVSDSGGPQWTATLTAPASYHGKEKVGGTAAATADSARQSTRVTVSLTGAAAGSTHPWHVHKGTCGHDQGIVGPADAYPPITTDSSGAGTGTANVSQVLSPSGQYMVNVHESASKMKSIVACGELKRAGQ